MSPFLSQANHLNQAAAFTRIKHRDALAIPLAGNPFARASSGTPHYLFHEVLENELWQPHRIADTEPTIREYNRVLARALKAAGVRGDDLKLALSNARWQQAIHGYGLDDVVDLVPEPIYAVLKR